MTTANHITRLELREELQEALRPVHERLESLEGDVQSVAEDMKWLKGHVGDLQIDMTEVKIKMGI